MEDMDLTLPPPPASLIRHALGVLSILSVLFSALVIITYGTGAAFRAFRALFAAFVLSFHVVSVVKLLFTESGWFSNKKKALFLSRDLHYFTLFVLLTIADLTPILTVVDYAITLTAEALNYLAADVLPLLGENAEQPQAMAKRFASHEAVVVVPVYLEIALIFQLGIIVAADWTLVNVATFVVYIVWIVMFNYGTCAAQRRVWAAIWRWSKENGRACEPVIDWIGGKFVSIGAVALRWYQ
jgi:hypothetical protein